MAGTVVALRGLFAGPPGWALLLGQGALGFIVYAALAALLDRVFRGGLLPSVRSALRGI